MTSKQRILLRQWAWEKAVETLERQRVSAPTFDQTMSIAKQLAEFALGSTSRSIAIPSRRVSPESFSKAVRCTRPAEDDLNYQCLHEVPLRGGE